MKCSQNTNKITAVQGSSFDIEVCHCVLILDLLTKESTSHIAKLWLFFYFVIG